MPWCHVCGREERAHDRFLDAPSPLRRTRRICPSCHAHRSLQVAHRTTGRLAFGFGVALIAVVVGRSAGLLRLEAIGFALVNVVLLVVMIALLIVPHEAAHVLVARALGLRVYRVRIGTGRLVWRSRIADVDVRLHAVPWSGGLTLYAPIDRSGLRLRRALVALAGPALHGVLLGLAMVVAIGVSYSEMGHLALGLDFAAANGVLLVLNLAPWRAPALEGIYESDGLVLLKAPFLKGTELANYLVSQFVTEATLLSEDGRYDEACQRTRAGLDAHPDSVALRVSLGMTLALDSRCEEAREAFRDALAQPNVPPEMQAILRNNVAWANLMLDTDLDEADVLSAQAMEQLGWSRPLQGTRGAVLVARGRIHAGLVLLHQALERPEQLHPMARATYEGAVALALARQGEGVAAQTHLARAREAFATCPLLPRVEEALARNGNASGPAA